MRKPGVFTRMLLARQKVIFPQFLTGKRIFILPTRSGLVFGCVLLAMLVAAINYTNNLAFLLTFLLASIAILSSIHAYANLVGLVLVQARLQPAYCTEEAKLHLIIEAGPRARRAVRIRLGVGSGTMVSLEPRERRELELRLPTVRRGRIQAGRLELSTRFPLGLFRAWSPNILPVTGIVYPMPVQADLHMLGTLSDAGDEQGAARSWSGEFDGIRPYRPEDGLSRVSWKASARGSGLFSKEYRAGLARTLLLDWEALRSGPYEERISRLAGMVREAERNGLRYALRLPDFVIQAGGGREHAHVCLEALALMPEQP